MSEREGTEDTPRTPSFRLDGQRALVTGAGRGLGAAIVGALAEAGAHVVLAARSGGEVEEGAQRLKARGFSAESVVLDVTDFGAVRDCAAWRERIDILVNNAGTNRPKPLAELTLEDYRTVMELNVGATLFMCQAFAEQARGRAGAIINISSQMGHVGAPNRSVYCASKHAVEGLTKALAVELAGAGIRVNAVAPTFIETPLTRHYLSDDRFRTNVLAKIKLGRLGRPEDVTGAVVFLASGAASLITGASLLVDGGWTAD